MNSTGIKASSRPRVVHVIDELPPDGAERLIVDVLSKRSANFDYQVLCLVDGGALVEELVRLAVPVTIMSKQAGADLGIVLKLIRWFRQQRIDVVHTHLFTADLWARFAAKCAGVSVIVSTSHSENNWKSALHRFLDRRMASISNVVIACTGQVKNVLIHRDGLPASKVRVVSNGINLDRFQGDERVDLSEFAVPQDHTTIAIVGRYHPVKGHLYFLDVFAQLRAKYKVSLLCIGDGEMREAIQEKIDKLGLSEDVHLCGFRSDVPALLNAVDIVAVPSELEGLPMVVLEAMVRAKPVVAHDVGGIADVISSPSLGSIVPAGDCSAMYNAIAALLDSPQHRKGVGVAAQALVYCQFDAVQTAAAYEAIYSECLSC